LAKQSREGCHDTGSMPSNTIDMLHAVDGDMPSRFAASRGGIVHVDIGVLSAVLTGLASRVFEEDACFCSPMSMHSRGQPLQVPLPFDLASRTLHGKLSIGGNKNKPK
jgi:hypothetical protein